MAVWIIDIDIYTHVTFLIKGSETVSWIYLSISCFLYYLKYGSLTEILAL